MAEGKVNVGEKYNKLTAVNFSHYDHRRKARWVWLCDCGNKTEAEAYNVKSGAVKSCGCHRIETNKNKATSHGMVGTPIYDCWRNMVKRCNNPNATYYAEYGGRGITVCERWENSFENFYADMGDIPEGLTIDRIDNDKGYEPGNCRWATKTEQARNRRNTFYVDLDGKKVSLSECAEKLTISAATIRWWLTHPMYGDCCVQELMKSSYKWKRPRILILIVTPDDKPEVLLRNVQHVVFKRKDLCLGTQELYIVQETA